MELQYCINCMEKIESYPCPCCGYDIGKDEPNGNALPPNTILNGKYLVGRVLGQGGFGITYIGIDLTLHRKVAIKEFFPSGQAVRTEYTGTALIWATTEHAREVRSNGQQTVLREAQKMAQVDSIPNVVKVLEVFAENSTAYIVMEYIQGETLKDKLKKFGPMSWDDAEKIFLPAIKTMEQVHKSGLIHRDLSPDNIMITRDGNVMILDLGAAKDLSAGSGGNSSVVVAKGGFTPVEQYANSGDSGPWTDVYAMAATIYYTLTGKLPVSALDRNFKDTLDWDLPQLKAMPAETTEGLKKAMSVGVESRTQSMAELLQSLEAKQGNKTKKEPPVKVAETNEEKTETTGTTKEKSKILKPVLACAAALVLIIGGVFMWGRFDKDLDIVTPAADTDATVEVEESSSVIDMIGNIFEPSAVKQLKAAKVGDYITYGKYEQDNDTSNGKEDIEWLVLDKQDDKALVISKYGLDCQQYNTEYKNVSWETCSLRSWLNDTFINEAFSAEEQKMIAITKVTAEKNPKYKINPGNDTDDKIFILNIQEAELYFNSAESRLCEPSAYAKSKGVNANSKNISENGEEACMWLLRSRGFYSNLAAYVYLNGNINYIGNNVSHSSSAIRPAMWINLEPSAETATPTPVPVSAEPIYTPGTYEATAKGIFSDVKVTMIFDENSIAEVIIDVSGETPGIGGAIGGEMAAQLLAAQSIEIDGVAGASITSEAIKEAAADCISQAST